MINSTFTTGVLIFQLFVVVYGLTAEELLGYDIVTMKIPKGYLTFICGKYDVRVEGNNGCDEDNLNVDEDIDDTVPNEGISNSKEARIFDIYR